MAGEINPHLVPDYNTTPSYRIKLICDASACVHFVTIGENTDSVSL